MTDIDFKEKTLALIDSLKSICANYGLGNDGNEFKIISQVFLYKFLNDKFAYDIKKIEPKLQKAEKWEDALKNYSDDDYEMLVLQLGADTAQIKPQHFISVLFGRQDEGDFAKLFDDTLMDIAITNNDIFFGKNRWWCKSGAL
jgi:type I restriction enzyme M protein